MTDLELLDQYCEKCIQFVNPFLFNEVKRRGLYDLINYLPNNTAEAKAVVRARLAAQGKYFDNEEIDYISQEISRLEALRNEMNTIRMTDVDKLIPILKEMRERSETVLNYFKS